MAHPSRILSIAVKEALEQAPLSLPIKAARGYRPRYLLSELESGIQVPCCPGGLGIEGADRSHTKNDVTVNLGILKKLAPGSTDGVDGSEGENLTELDALTDLVHEIARFFLPEDNEAVYLEADGKSYVAKTVNNEQAYDQNHLDQNGQFTSVLSIGFDLWTGGR